MQLSLQVRSALQKPSGAEWAQLPPTGLQDGETVRGSLFFYASQVWYGGCSHVSVAMSLMMMMNVSLPLFLYGVY